MKIKRNIVIMLIAVLALIAVITVVVAKGAVTENWRMRIVARQLEQSESLRDAYGPDCSITQIEGGLQPGEVFHGYVYHLTPFQVHSDKVDKRIWVKWSNRPGRMDVRVHTFTENETPYPSTLGIMK